MNRGRAAQSPVLHKLLVVESFRFTGTPDLFAHLGVVRGKANTALTYSSSEYSRHSCSESARRNDGAEALARTRMPSCATNQIQADQVTLHQRREDIGQDGRAPRRVRRGTPATSFDRGSGPTDDPTERRVARQRPFDLARAPDAS